jgi:enoyl reductase-like protein
MLQQQVENRAKGIVVDRRLVAAMQALLPVQTKECIMDTLGISANTWVKVKRGEAVRRSTVEYLIRRVEQIGPHCSSFAGMSTK